jgi:hypothetical protein
MTGGTPSSSAVEVGSQGGGPGYGGGGALPSEAGHLPQPRRQALRMRWRQGRHWAWWIRSRSCTKVSLWGNPRSSDQLTVAFSVISSLEASVWSFFCGD